MQQIVVLLISHGGGVASINIWQIITVNNILVVFDLILSTLFTLINSIISAGQFSVILKITKISWPYTFSRIRLVKKRILFDLNSDDAH